MLALRVDDIAPAGNAAQRAICRQRKTGRPVKFEPTETTRQALNDYLLVSAKSPSEYLFSGRRGRGQPLTARHYARLVSK